MSKKKEVNILDVLRYTYFVIDGINYQPRIALNDNPLKTV